MIVKAVLLATSIIGVISLVGCNAEPEAKDIEVVVLDQQESIDEMPIEPPPSIQKRGVFRCEDNSLIYIDFFSDETMAHLRTERHGKPIILAAPTSGLPFVQGGYSVSGRGQIIQLRRPGKAEVTCQVGAAVSLQNGHDRPPR